MKPKEIEIDDYVEFYGERYRHLIKDALEWLDKREPHWGLKKPIDRDGFIHDLVDNAV